MSRIIAILRERHIGKLMSGFFVLFAIMSLGSAIEDPFLNRVTHVLNAYTSGYPLSEPPVSGLQVLFKALDVAVFAFLAWIFYKWFGRKREEEPVA